MQTPNKRRLLTLKTDQMCLKDRCEYSTPHIPAGSRGQNWRSIKIWYKYEDKQHGTKNCRYLKKNWIRRMFRHFSTLYNWPFNPVNFFCIKWIAGPSGSIAHYCWTGFLTNHWLFYLDDLNRDVFIATGRAELDFWPTLYCFI